MTYDLLFDQEGLLVAKDYAPMVEDPLLAGCRPPRRIWPGEVTSGGGFIGGTFGFEGAVTGNRDCPALLNAATTSARMETVLQLEALNAEAFFHYGRWSTPWSDQRLQLSAVFGRIRRQAASPMQKRERGGDRRRALEAGRPSTRGDGFPEEEFEAAKRRLIGA